MTRLAISLAVLAVTVVSVAGQQRTPEAPTRATVIRVAYTTFESPDRIRSRGTLDPIVTFLRESGMALTRSTGRPVEFEVVLGNYYQVWSWFRARQIDAAFVSPFIAYLLERDGSALSVLELPEHDPEGTYAPFVAASNAARDDPRGAYDRHLTRLLEEAKGLAPSQPELTRLNLVAHLSASGFVMPTLYALDWLKDQNAPADVRARFWRLYVERARFTLFHGVPRPESGNANTDIFFSYSGRRRSSLDADVSTGNLGQWVPLTAGDPDWPAPRIPADLLVVRPRLAEEVLQTVDRNELADRLISIARSMRVFTSETTYTDVRRFNVATQSAFREAVDRLFSRRAEEPFLKDLNGRWFEKGRFDFTIDETMGFLRQDQLNSGVSRLALVLSGGGVKSLYQARLLDELYRDPTSSERMLRNFNEEPLGPNALMPPASDGPLTVHTIIGTSGGAMLAFFAALMPSIKQLTPLAREAASKPLFPILDVPRVVSIIAILLVFVACLHIAKAFAWIRVPADSAQPWQIPRGVRALLAAPLLLVSTALIIRFLRVPHIEGVGYVRGLEGLLYGLAAAFIHVAAVCITRHRLPVVVDATRSAQGRLGILLGVSIVATAIALRVLVSGTDPTDQVLVGVPLLAGTGIVLLVGSVILAASGGWLKLQLVYAREYLSALAVVAIVIVTSYLAILLATMAGHSTFLELTPTFWLWALAGGLLASTVLMLATRNQSRFGKFVELATYSLVRDRVGGLTLTIGASMTAFFALAILLWVVLVAPAVYGSDRAEEALVNALPEKTLWSGAFRANLIVTGALLADTHCAAQQRDYLAGPLYSCFEGPASCVPASPYWETFRRPVPARALHSVFASGSPFPVFPAHNVSLPNGCVVPLIDGGYAHNVPLEAAVEAEARQVLVINASPDPADDVKNAAAGWQWHGLLSDLAQGAQRIFPFLFSQAQELDRSMARRLMVASLTPHPDNDDWPFLLDFRRTQQDRVIGQADVEIQEIRRIGHLEAWGTPLVYAVVRPPETRQAAVAISDVTPLAQSRWLPDVRGTLEELLRRSGGGVAVFDLDNTCLRGDIGDALLLKIVAELHYAGDREEFWAQIPDEQARNSLRAYWRQFTAARSGKAPRLLYADPSTWPPGFEDYVALFFRQYQQLLDQQDGARRAYPWVVRMMTGMTLDTVLKLSRELWSEEMQRGTSRQYIHSAMYGDFVIEGGVRLHGEVADLIDALTSRGWQVWIVTASNQYVAEEAAARLGIEADRVLGIRPRIVDGVLTSMLQEPVTYREGKRQILVERKLTPDIVVGDSMTDYEMLRVAPLALVIDRGRIDRGLMTEPPKWLLQPATTLTLRNTYE